MRLQTPSTPLLAKVLTGIMVPAQQEPLRAPSISQQLAPRTTTLLLSLGPLMIPLHKLTGVTITVESVGAILSNRQLVTEAATTRLMLPITLELLQPIIYVT